MMCLASFPTATGTRNTLIVYRHVYMRLYKLNDPPSNGSISLTWTDGRYYHRDTTSRRHFIWNPYALPFETPQIARHTRSWCARVPVSSGRGGSGDRRLGDSHSIPLCACIGYDLSHFAVKRDAGSSHWYTNFDPFMLCQPQMS